MARFYLTASNSRGNTVSAAGSSRGQDAHLRGWNAGVEILASVDETGRDVFDIYATRGSNGGRGEHIMTVREPRVVGEAPEVTPA